MPARRHDGLHIPRLPAHLTYSHRAARQSDREAVAEVECDALARRVADLERDLASAHRMLIEALDERDEAKRMRRRMRQRMRRLRGEQAISVGANHNLSQ